MVGTDGSGIEESGADDVEKVFRDLREQGLTLIQSIAALVKEGRITPTEAQGAVFASSVWADQRDRVFTRRTIPPPGALSETVIQRLHAALAETPEVVEAWLIGSHDTTPDGSSRETTAVALILEPFDEQSDRHSLLEKLVEATEGSEIGSWLFASGSGVTGIAEHGEKIYP